MSRSPIHRPPLYLRGRVWLSVLMVVIWGLTAVCLLMYYEAEKSHARFPFFVTYQGLLSPLQREKWLSEELGLFPLDRLIEVDGRPFEPARVKQMLRAARPRTIIALTIGRSGETKQLRSELRRYAPNDRFVLFLIPFLLSILFFGFSLVFLFLREVDIHRREPVVVLSLLTWTFSLWLLVYLPSLTLAWALPLASFLPVMTVMVLHLFWVYPKEKMTRLWRHSLLAVSYLVALSFVALDLNATAEGGARLFPFELGLSGFGLLVALGSVSNTLLRSRDFWTRRRARLLSFVLLFSFIAAAALYWAQFSDIPHFSLERILGLSLIFPSAFAVIFLKENVFDLERLFRHGAHQLLALAMAISLAVSVGWAWSQSRIWAERDWPLWISIAVITLIVARPLAAFVENIIHRLIRTRVPYPPILEIADRSRNVHEFVDALLKEVSENLSLRNVALGFPLDPSQNYGPLNRQIWIRGREGTRRVHEWPERREYSFPLERGDKQIGEIVFEGGDRIAFDPFYSKDWQKSLVELSRALENLLLRDFVLTQQGLLAVGRMQALLAHHMKNPLAIIKVCAGLLQQRVEGAESEELVKTIQDEVVRVSKAVQSVFDQSTIAAHRARFPLLPILSEIHDATAARFSHVKIVVHYDDAVGRGGILEMEKEGLYQSVINLMTNACEAGATEISLKAFKQGRDLKMEVIDNGSGIAEHVALFQPFSTTKTQGSGLGLLFVKAFVERHHGQIRVQSEKNKGTTFVLQFPDAFSDATIVL